jgi:very-short-patch-repair endonuclease
MAHSSSSMLDLMLRRLARDQWVRLHGTPRVTVLVGGPHGREIWNQWIALMGLPGTLVEGGSEDGGDGGDGGDGDAAQRFDEQIRAAVARAVQEPAHPIAVAVTAEVASRWRTGRRDRLAALVDEGWIVVPEPRAHGDARAGRGARRAGTDGGAAGSGPVDGWESGLGAGGAAAGGAPPDAAAAMGGMPRDGGEVDGDDGAVDVDGGEVGEMGYDPRDVVDDGPRRDLDDAGDDGGDAPPLEAGGTVAPQFYLDARSVAEAMLFEALEATPSTAGRFRLNESLSVRFGPTAAEVDLLSRADRIAIEIDGMHHFADLVCYRRDRRKDLLLQTQGFVVVRLLAEDVVRDVRSAVTAVNQALAYRLGEDRNDAGR